MSGDREFVVDLSTSYLWHSAGRARSPPLTAEFGDAYRWIDAFATPEQTASVEW